MMYNKFSKLFVIISISILSFILLLNIIVDPYSMTKYNILDIPNKFARDDRAEKVTKLYIEPRYDNMIFGSSRVYVMNPLMISKYLGGRTYNCGVGRSRIEDQLGFLLFLQKISKLPKNAIFGLDFYSFNKNFESSKYFIKNNELNFVRNYKSNNLDIYLEKFFSIDAIRATYKTLDNYITNSIDKPRFDKYGAFFGASSFFEYYPEKILQEKFSEKVVEEDKHKIKTFIYSKVSKERLKYLKKIVDVCEENSMNCYFFTTPLNGQMLDEFTSDSEQKILLSEFKSSISEITPYYDFLNHNEIIDNSFYFMDTMHFTRGAGNLVFARLFYDANISLPESFGALIK